MTRRRKIIVAVAVLTLVAGSFGAGTLATFNAQTNNAGNVFGHGTIVLSNTKQGGSACLSTGGMPSVPCARSSYACCSQRAESSHHCAARAATGQWRRAPGVRR